MQYVGKAGLVVLLFTLQIFVFSSFANGNADEILKKARQQLDSKSDQARVALKIIEPNGDVKTREMTLQILRTKGGFKSIIRMISPADVKDTALLAQMEDGKDQEWLYLPSSKQVRRITATKKSSGILGSELAAEDLDPMAFTGAGVKLESQSSTNAVVSVTPKKGSSEYSKVLTSFSLPDALPRKTEYFKGAKLIKTVEYLNYKAFGMVQRPQSIRIMNVVKKRGTNIDFSHISVNPKLAAKDFTPDALKESW